MTTLEQLVLEAAEHGEAISIGYAEHRGYWIGYMWDGGMVGGGEDDLASGDTIEAAAERGLKVMRERWSSPVEAE